MPAAPAVPASLPSPRRSPRALAALAALSAALIAAAALPASAPAAPRCAPADGLRTAAIERTQHRDGSAEVTEYLSRGAYRVTRCGADGRPRVSQTVSPILDPDGGVTLVPTERQEPGLTVSLLYGDPSEPSWAADFRATRAAREAATLAPTTPAPAQAPRPRRPRRVPRRPLAARAAAVTTAGAADACTNAQYSPWTGIWTAATTATASTAAASTTTTRRSPRSSAVTRTGTRRTTAAACNDITNLTSFHLGSTSLDDPHLSRRRVGRRPRRHDRDRLRGRAGLHDELHRGQRLDRPKATSATTRGRRSRTSARSAPTTTSPSPRTRPATAIGLGHANSSDALTMFYAIRAGETHARSLAKGDVMGMRARYP